MSAALLDSKRSQQLAGAFWPRESLGRAVAEVLFRSELPLIRQATTAGGAPGVNDPTAWLCHAARPLGAAGLATVSDTRGLPDALARAGAYVVLAKSGKRGGQALALVRRGRRACIVIAPDGGELRLSIDALCRALGAESAEELSWKALFEGLPGGRRVLQRTLAQRESAARTLSVVYYSPSGAQPFWSQLRYQGVLPRLLAYVVITAMLGLVSALAAFTLGASALTGVVDASRVVAWSLLAASNVPLQYVAALLLGNVTLDAAGAFKQRLLEGALGIGEEELRATGFGSMIARLNEASVVEQTNVAELFSVIAPMGQMLAAVVLLSLGVLPQVLLPLLAGFVLVALGLGIAYQRRYRACYLERLLLTEDLVEKIVGHRTRAVQANQNDLHDKEDAALHDYARASTRLDRLATLMEVFGRLWLLAVGGGLLSAFALGATGAVLLPSAVGGFLVYTSLPALLSAAQSYAAWSCAWRGVRPLFDAGLLRTDAVPKSDTADAGRSTIVSAVSFAYRSREVLRDVNLRIESGERILIGGPSGGGKTTFSKLLTGELRAGSGTILVGGVDSASVSDAAWRRRVAASPQFHENYVFSNTFGFNVDPLGNEGELSPEAREVCFELGLKSLIGKMPSRAAQLLGETGWQLSHGERSRVFIARSLLQGADLLVFDESFAALDPESLELAMRCVRKRAPTLLVIAHQ